MKRLGYITLLLMAVASCRPKPEACLALDEVYEVNRTYNLASCSEQYEFITWEFGENTNGFIGDTVPHAFRDIGQHSVAVTAYARGGYRSDKVQQIVRASRRYIDRFEVVGTSDYNRFIFTFGTTEVSAGDASGEFTEAQPFVGSVWPDDTLVIPMERVQFYLDGKSGSSTTRVIQQKEINFTRNLDNPVVVQEGDFELRVYWTFD